MPHGVSSDRVGRDRVAVIAALLGLTSVASVAFIALTLTATLESMREGEPLDALGTLVVAFFGSALALGSIVYQVSRFGHLKRRHEHQGASHGELRQLGHIDAPKVVVLVPSYREDRDVIRRTLLSAALQEYGNLRIVLLVDDSPNPRRARETHQLLATRDLVRDIRDTFTAPAAVIQEAAAAFFNRRDRDGRVNRDVEARALAGVLSEIAAWLEALASTEVCVDNAGLFFKEHVLLRAARRYRATAQELQWHADQDGRFLKESYFEREYERLEDQLDARITSFERKQYANLSHAPNKAMNLNSYIGLLGTHVREVSANGSLRLQKCSPHHPDAFAIADADYVLTLDADSIVLAEYTVRLVHLMEERRNRAVAVAQTPYSAFPGPTTALERAAGATTDIQYLIHQGFTEHNATFWVGANALLRKSALDQIATEGIEDGKPVRRYVSDRTVIEDTESSVDLVARGWRLFNYPERLAFSATPPDFGALIVQRRRWANGGLLILPKLLRYLRGSPLGRASIMEGLLRVHYLTSISAVNVALVLFLVLPLPDARAEAALFLTALPYYVLYARDLVACGYRHVDALRVYALNLLLVPVNLAGVLRSIEQGVLGRKSAFARTPKVSGRTSIPPFYGIAILALLVYCALCSVVSLSQESWVHAGFGALNAAFVAYGMVTLIGLRRGGVRAA
jgi:cellulose synthase (UDP-forming)